MKKHWVRLGSGWLDMGRIGFVSETMGDALNLWEEPSAIGDPSMQLTGQDAQAVREYLEKAAVNKPEPSKKLRGTSSTLQGGF